MNYLYHKSILRRKKGKRGFSRETISVLRILFTQLHRLIEFDVYCDIESTMNALMFSCSQESRIVDTTCDIIIKILVSFSTFLYILNINKVRNKVKCIRYYSAYFYEIRNIRICECESIHSWPIRRLI